MANNTYWFQDKFWPGDLVARAVERMVAELGEARWNTVQRLRTTTPDRRALCAATLVEIQAMVPDTVAKVFAELEGQLSMALLTDIADGMIVHAQTITNEEHDKRRQARLARERGGTP